MTVSPAIAGATKVRLLFASIGIPLASTVAYYLIRCPQLGIGVRSAAGSSGTTFIIPVNSQPGYRSLFGSQNEFLYSANLQQQADDISRLDFSVLKYGGAAAGMTENSYYTVMFGVSRALGVLSQLFWDRALGLAIERPKSLTLEHIRKVLDGQVSADD